jgi:hypothetical protein
VVITLTLTDVRSSNACGIACEMKGDAHLNKSPEGIRFELKSGTIDWCFEAAFVTVKSVEPV